MFHLKSILLIGILLAVSAEAQCVITSDGFGERSYVLYAGQSLDAGSVTVQVTNENLVVQYQTTGLWKLGSAALWVGSSSNGYPQTKTGNPIPGKFPYKSGTLTNATSYLFSIPLAILGFQCPADNAIFFFMAHADLYRTNYDGSIQRETGWSEGDRVVEKGNWATRSNFELSCDCDDGGEGNEKTCETAFAYDPDKASCFLEHGFDRWGWTNGPYNIYAGAPPETLYLYAAAGQCDLSKGYLAGIVTLSYMNQIATVLYDTQNTGWTLREIHTYLGNNEFPLSKGAPTVSPGQFPVIHENLNDTTKYTVQINMNPYGLYYLIAHGVVCR